ncbi:MAG: DUF1080 domain-containing protein [Ignavibacteriae bacterium]|nr:DUF1080 domain-containing protein [Ignavibacteriota bacterium]MCB9211096.1 DUF1080 domain-containing protein [Ignavibacteriales bacterium]
MNQLLCFLCFLLLGVLIEAQTINFDKDETGKVPNDFSTVLSGKGEQGVWVVMNDETAPSKPNVLAQTDMDDTGYRFPLCVYNNFSAKNVDVSVKFKPVKGDGDQAAGIVWRYKDKDNYYIVRANALEDNVVLYKLENGKRTDLPLVGKGRTYGEDVEVPANEWSVLRVYTKDDLFDVYLNGKKIFSVKDSTFTTEGKVGLWTKADSYTLFDDFTFRELK